MTFQRRTLGEICDEAGGEVRTGPFGSQLHESDYSDDGQPVVMPRDIIKGRVSEASIARVSAGHVERLAQHKLAVGDIVYGRRGDIGRQALITERESGWLCGTGCLRITPGKTAVDSTWLHYYLREEKVIEFIAQQAVGATMPNLNTSILRSIPITYPDKATQRRIASILSAYDDLIENNTRRIAILEEMARRIYEEWFVRFRFPGHEQVRMVESELGLIPEGWSVGQLSVVVRLLSGFAFKTQEFVENGAFGLVTIKNVQDGEFVSECTSKLAAAPLKMPSYCHLKTGDLLLSLTGNVGRCCSVIGTNYLLNQRVAKLDPVTKSDKGYVQCAFRSADMRQKLESISNGVAQQNLSPIETAKLPWLIPSTDLRVSFAEATNGFFELAINLRLKNCNLRTTRDLLLPKLISGELDVSNLPEPEAMAA